MGLVQCSQSRAWSGKRDACHNWFITCSKKITVTVSELGSTWFAEKLKNFSLTVRSGTQLGTHIWLPNSLNWAAPLLEKEEA